MSPSLPWNYIVEQFLVNFWRQILVGFFVFDRRGHPAALVPKHNGPQIWLFETQREFDCLELSSLTLKFWTKRRKIFCKFPPHLSFPSLVLLLGPPGAKCWQVLYTAFCVVLAEFYLSMNDKWFCLDFFSWSQFKDYVNRFF